MSSSSLLRVASFMLMTMACTTGSCAMAAPKATVASVLAANRAAVGGHTGSATIETEYAYAGQDLTGTTRSITDRVTGAYVDRYEIGITRGASGFDGRLAWMQDISGACTPQDGGDRRAIAVNEAYRNADRWWRGDRGGAAIELVGREAIDGATADHLRVTPRSGKAFDAWFDTTTHHLVRVDEDQQFLHNITRFAGYAPEQGMTVAHTITVDGGTGPSGLQTTRLTRLTLGPPRPLADFALPAGLPDDAAIDHGAASTTVPIRLANNHIYVDATVNGQGPFPFMVDTGGHTILTPSTLAALHLEAQGSAPSAGAGEQTTTNGYVHVREIAVGAMRLREQTAFTLDFASKETEGLDVGGMIGFEVFRRFVARIDYGNLTLTLIDPARFDPRGAGTEIPFRFYDHLPQVDGRVGDHPARLDIDTGSRSEVDLTTPFVERARLREAYPHGTLALSGWGVGGPVKSYVVRGPPLTLGTVTIRRPVASLSTSRAGSFSDANYEANVGSGLLKRFVVTFDYAHQRIYLRSRVPPPADVGTFDQSGAWINLAASGFVVADVSPGGPAEKAGLSAGDVITAIDGKPWSSLTLSDARGLFRTPAAGTVVRIESLRNGVARTSDLTLRNLIGGD